MLSDLKSKLSSVSDLKEFCQKLVWGLAKTLEASQAAFYIKVEKNGLNFLQFVSGYAYQLPDSKPIEFEFGEGLAGQVAKEGEMINIASVPNGYIQILSGLGKSTPTSLAIFPLKKSGEVIAVIEIASFKPFLEEDEKLFKSVSEEFAEQLAQLLKA